MPILRLLLEFPIETPDFPWPRSHQQCCPPCVGLQCLHQRRTVGALGEECFKYSHNPKVRAPKKASIKYRQGNNNIWLNSDFSILANIPRGLWLFSTVLFIEVCDLNYQLLRVFCNCFPSKVRWWWNLWVAEPSNPIIRSSKGQHMGSGDSTTGI